jgi:hypothetical protein
LSTNYRFIEANAHIGKRSAGPAKRPMFTWAQEPAKIRATCKLAGSKKIITDGDKEFTGKEFLKLLDECILHNTELLGETFS